MTLDEIVQSALDAHRNGQTERADRLYRSILALIPSHVLVLLQRARLYERPGGWSEALALYEHAARLEPGLALPTTRRSLLLLRSRLGLPPAPVAPKPLVGRIAMTSLGANGRFGNQLLQYGFLRLYGETHHRQIEAPDWIGRDLFGLNDPLPGPGLQEVREDQTDLVAALMGDTDTVHHDANLWGYFCGPTGRWARHRDRFRNLFRWHGGIAAIADAASARLDALCGDLVAIHLRRGDFVSGNHWIPPNDWYREWLAALWPGLDRPRLYVASDDPAASADFADFAPIVGTDIAPPLPGAEFLTDFLALTRAHRLAVSNSSFSFTAAMLNSRCRSFVRPDPALKALVPFDPWDAPVVLQV